MNGKEKKPYGVVAVRKCPCLMVHEPRATTMTEEKRRSYHGLGQLNDTNRRILTCVLTAVVVVLVVIAVVLTTVLLRARGGGPGTLPEQDVQESVFSDEDPVTVVPTPQNLVDRTNTIVVHRKNPAIWQSQSSQLKELLRGYNATRQTSNFPVDVISRNCTAASDDFYGYKKGSPCVALVFRPLVPGWRPRLYRPEDADVPEEVTLDPSLLYVSCGSEHISRDLDIRYSPYHGFPSRFFPVRDLPPLVMLHFPNPPVRTDIWVTCRFWAKNFGPGNGKVTFKLLIV